MPTPREAYANTVDRQGYSGARVRAADYGASGEIIGRAAQGFGRDLQQVSQDIDETQTIYAVAAAKKADTSAMPRLSAILTAVKNTEGMDTTAAKIQAEADIDALEKEHLASLENPRAQRIFQESFSQRKASAIASISEYEHDQVRVALKNESIAHRDTSISTAVDNYANPEEFGKNLSAALADVDDILKGAAPGTIAAEKAKVVSQTHAQVFEALNAKQDFLGAEAWRVANSDNILPDTESAMMRANAPGLFDSRIDIMWNAVASGSEDAGLVATVTPETDAGRLPVNPIEGRQYNPVAGARRTGDAASHARRGSHNKGIDFAAATGSAIHPPMSGKVVEAGYNESNGNFVKVRYDNGLTGIFLHLKGPPPVDEGSPVGPGTIIGAVGNTGKSKGAHVHYSVKDAAGNYVDPDTVRYEGGSNKSPQYKPEDTDTAALFNRIYAFSEKNNLTGRETDALIARANAYSNRNQALKQEDEARRTDAAMEQATALGEKLTKESQIPGYAALPWQAKDRIKSQIEQNTKPKEPQAGGQDYIDAMVTAENEPETFQRMHLDGMSLTREERTRLKIKQGTLSNGDGTPKQSAIDDDSTITQRMNTYLRREGLVIDNVDKVNEINMREELRARVVQRIQQRESETKKKLGFNEIDAIVQEQVTKVTYTDPTGKQASGRLFQVPGFAPGKDKLGINPRDRARNALRRANRGIPPTEGQIDEFLRLHGGN